MFNNYKNVIEQEKARLEHHRELRKDVNARYYKKRKDDVKVKKAKGRLKIYDEYKEKKEPEFVGY